MLYGREAEQARLRELLGAARDGTGGALVLRGGPGIGKTALLDWAAGLDATLVLRGGGVEFEADLPFAGLSQLLRPVLPRLERLPAPQRAALAGAFGLGPAGAADRLLVGFGVLSLLAEAAEDGPVLCLVDDAQWLDSVSADALLFAARRLRGEGVALVLAARDGAFALPEVHLSGLADADAVRLIEDGLDPGIRRRILAEAQGNPLALIELPRTAGPSAGGALSERLLAAFHGQVAGLPDATRAVLLAAAAEDTGDLGVVLRAAGRTVEDLRPAEQARLVEVTGGALRFRHPLVRAAVYHGAPFAQRVAVHRALAAALTGPESADRRAWHRAAAATEPDDDVAAALEDTARQARDRGGYGAAASAYERAAGLSGAPPDQARRLLLAAENALLAGDPAAAVRHAERSAGLDTDPAFLGRVGWVEGQAWFWQGNHGNAYELLTAAAGLAPDTAGRALLQAVHPAWYLGEPHLGECLDRLATLDSPVARYVVAAVRSRPRPMPPLDPALSPRDFVEVCGFGFVAGQDAEAHAMAAALAARCRAEGLAGPLPTLLFFLAEAELFAGRHRDAAVSAAEGLAIAAGGGQPLWVSQLSAVHATLAAISGDEDACRAHAAGADAAAAPGVDPAGHAWAQWALALLDLGQGRPEPAVPRLRALQSQPYAHHVVAHRCIPDLIEATVRSGAASPFGLARLESFAERTGQAWAQALVHRCRALLGGDEHEYRMSLKLPARPFERARTELLYGEWLRRARRKADARPVLQSALDAFDRLGARPWAARARAELTATGLPASSSSPPAEPAAARLTPQELQIARLAAQGLSNKDIAAQLFLSPKTVAYHLYKAYPKLGVAARTDLAALPL